MPKPTSPLVLLRERVAREGWTPETRKLFYEYVAAMQRALQPLCACSGTFLLKSRRYVDPKQS